MSTVGGIAAVITALAVFAATIAGSIEFFVRRAVVARFDVEFVALSSCHLAAQLPWQDTGISVFIPSCLARRRLRREKGGETQWGQQPSIRFLHS